MVEHDEALKTANGQTSALTDGLGMALLPCPFCGDMPNIVEARVYNEEDGDTVSGVSIKCMNKMCGMQPATYPCAWGSLILFAHNWNKRTPPNAKLSRASTDLNNTADVKSVGLNDGLYTMSKLEKDIKETRAYQQLPDELRQNAVIIAGRMLKAAGKITPTELGAASALCLELALFIKGNGGV